MKAANKTVRYYTSQFIKHISVEQSLERETMDRFNFLVPDQRTTAFRAFRKSIQPVAAEYVRTGKKKSIMVNPVYDVPNCKRVNDQSPHPIAEFDIQEFKEAIKDKDPQLWLAISFEYYCFIRPGKELRKLKIKDIDFERGLVDVDQFRAKTNLERFPTIPLVFLLELRNVYLLHTYHKDFYILGKDGKPGPDHLGKNNMTTRFRKIRESLNMPELYKFYSWKHTCNGRAADAGISKKALQEQNGHLSIVTTEKYMRFKVGKVNKKIQKKFPLL